MEIVDSGVIFRNPLPGHRVINAIYPMIYPLPGGELLCALRVCSALYSRDGEVELFRSSDGGRTWERQGPVRDRSADVALYSDFSGTLTGLRDGALLLRLEDGSVRRVLAGDVTLRSLEHSAEDAPRSGRTSTSP